MAPVNTEMADDQQAALLRPGAPANAAAAADQQDVGFSWLTLLGFVFLTFNSAMAIYRSNGHLAAIAFVAFSYIDLVLLFICLRWYEKAAPGSPTRGNLKVAVWILTTLLTMAFSYKVAAIMPMAVKVLVWAMACATVLGGFYAFFVYKEGKVEEAWRKFDRGGPFLNLSIGLLEQNKAHIGLGQVYRSIPTQSRTDMDYDVVRPVISLPQAPPSPLSTLPMCSTHQMELSAVASTASPPMHPPAPYGLPNHLHPVYTWRSKVKLDTDGRMVLKDYNGQIVWTNNVSVSDAMQVQAQLLDTGNLIVKGKNGTILWQSFDFPTDTLLPTQSITATTKLVSTNRLLDPGRYSFHFDDQYLLSLFYYQKDISFIYWPNPNRNIWDKLRMSFNSTTGGALDRWGHFLGSDNATFTAADWGPGITRKLTLDYDGNLRLYSLNKQTECGPSHGCHFLSSAKYVVCAADMGYVYTHQYLPVCVPLVLKSSTSDRSKGCKRTINISCDAQKVRFSKLPNTDFFGNDMSVHRFVSLDYCKNICLNDCKCKGFAYWEGIGDCYPKAVLHGGATLSNLGSTGTMYIKIHKGAKVPGSVPQSQPFGSKYGPDCRSTNKYFIPDFLDMLKSSQSDSKFLYFYGFLSAAFLAEQFHN
ncbi:hypothetical protein EJB05_41351 [Eragrostis curvula]|uniref:non-specific serine/threonine protein kinase n=1 Tax=Eragrostis curvula TaxID=38414 RepID=A0A5J9T978_9POAL|nr:hypothetical protein EJB05_41351 [Eragrostis curvula]